MKGLIKLMELLSEAELSKAKFLHRISRSDISWDDFKRTVDTEALKIFKKVDDLKNQIEIIKRGSK